MDFDPSIRLVAKKINHECHYYYPEIEKDLYTYCAIKSPNVCIEKDTESCYYIPDLEKFKYATKDPITN
jgi:hypothetical protein